MSDTKTGKAIDFKLLKRVITFTRPYQKVLYLSMFFSILLSFLSPIRPFLINYAVDNYIMIPDAGQLKFICVVLLSILVLEAIVQFLYIYLATWLGQNVIQDLRAKTYQHILKLKMTYFDNTPIGSLVTRTVSDIETISDIFSQGLFVIIGELLKLIVVVCMMFYTDWRLALISLLAIPILLVATAWFKRNIKSAFQEVRREVSNINTFVQEHIVGMNLVQIFNREDAEFQKFKEINKNHLNAHLKSVFYYSVFFPVVEILSALSIGLIIWYGGEAIISGKEVTLGELVAFILYIHMMFRPIRQLADRFNILQMGIVGSERVFKVLDTKEFISDEGIVIKDELEGTIEYKDVNFAYKKEEWILKNLSFKIDKGKNLALVGRTGAGKTSIINILNRFYEIQSGSITIDGIRIEDFKLNNLRKHIALVQQEVHLFSASIMKNIMLFDEGITEDRVVNAAKEIGIHDFIMSLPGGYNYVVGERGVTLSTGQRQLISFLRVYLRNPQVLILDEATSSIDSYTENILQSALHKISEGRTTIVIAHRLSTIVNSDKILLLENGAVEEEGNHKTLMKLNRKYKQMYSTQFSSLN
ncbi:MAG: antibiotic ABC transporter ATP-binding protein [Flavobacteriales bacterium]|nr:antibiotic ABC transporter ATP-binding protein [Flavobacteriales bacterium]|tara:strand:- start:10941 stop:12701 length:1761 start_codon:yes stop_codon:yes gene_type:complete